MGERYFAPKQIAMKNFTVGFKISVLMVGLLLLTNWACNQKSKGLLSLKKETRIVLIGNNLAARMGEMGNFETELYVRYPDSLLIVRNMGDGGNTPGFRPHSSRNSPWAFPGQKLFKRSLRHKLEVRAIFQPKMNG